jgi:iron(III) transport system permease protein
MGREGRTGRTRFRSGLSALRASRLPVKLSAASLVVGLLASVPLVYIVIRAVGAEAGTWGNLFAAHIPGLLLNTVLLVLLTSTLGALLGVSLAYLVERTDLPGRGFLRWALVLPLVVPAYVGALTYLVLFRRGGLVEGTAINLFGLRQGQMPLPDLYNLFSAGVIIALFTFPYVYLPVSAALRSADRTVEEASRMSGRTGWGTFRAVTLPIISPSLLTGMLLISLYVISDFGTVALLRYRTFTVAIYNQFAGSIDREAAAILSFVLIALTLPLLFGEGWLNGRGGRYGGGSQWRPHREASLGRWKGPALALTWLVLGLSLLLPVAVLAGLTLQGIFAPTPVDRIWSVGGEGLWQHALNSLLVASFAATLAVFLAFVPAYLAARHGGVFARVLAGLSKAGYALPGLIVGLSLVMLFSNWLPALYGTVFVLVLAFSIRFLPQAIASIEAALKTAPPNIEGAARVMGRNSLQVFREVTLPVAAPGVMAGWVLVFLTAMKELPTAMLLRPPGYDTLSVRIWAASSESVYTQAAPPAIALIGITVILLTALHFRGKIGIDQVLR